MAALAPSKILGTQINFAGSSRYNTAAPTAGAQKIVSLLDRFTKKPAPSKPKPAVASSSSPDISDELAKWYGE
jgi:light-harvesting complex II chlorophyll a/b binding protein 5